MSTLHSYPNIFVHGMLGWAGDDGLNKMAPYWGMLCGNLTEKLSAEGRESYSVKVGPLSSAWDRACDLYALLTGTKTDYGKAHSEKFGHNRFGRTYDKPLIEGWGQPYPNSDGIKKINLIGHSFGGATIRMLVELLTNGSKEEMEATDKEDISPLFTGGKGEWVHALVAVSAPHEGTTLFYAVPPLYKFASLGTFLMANVLGNTKLNEGYDWLLDQWGLSSVPRKELPDKTKMFNLKQIQKALESKDNLWYDLTLEGAKKVNEIINCNKDTYYFSLAGSMTDEDMLTGHQHHSRHMFPLLWPLAHEMGKYDHNDVNDIPVDKRWCENDGCLPTISGLHPFDEPFTDYEEAKAKDDIKKGIWHVMPVQHADHGKIIGGSFDFVGKSHEFTDFYEKLVDMLNNLK